MTSRLVAMFLLGAIVIWAFAIVGMVTVARAIGESETTARAPSLLAPTTSDAAGWDIAGLPRYPRSVRSEHRVAEWGATSLTEVEYTSGDGVDEVLEHYHGLLRTGEWRLTSITLVRGEWVIAVENGQRVATIEIARHDGVTEMEIELVEPTTGRQRESGR